MRLITNALLLAVVGISALGAEDLLLEKAKSYGLEPIPNDIDTLMSIINDKNDPISYPKIELGKKLYFDPRLSKSGLISCNTCHNLALGGADGVSAAIGHKWTINPHHLNSPTVFNSVFNQAQFWDGRSPHLADQAQGPIQADAEMAAPQKLVVDRVTSIPQYVEDFKKAYGANVKITFEKIASVIGVFERTLITPSPYDDFLNGNENALNSKEKAGLDLFMEKGCTACHNGIALGGTMQPFQVASQYKFASLGDFSGDENGMVKTPTLRNIAETAPYFHNGGIWELEEAIQEMGSIQLGIDISDKEAKSIAVFLGSLTGKKSQIIYPVLPPSTKNTPKPSAD
ncbi:MAG: cytochrome-c peroxidase [Campylobacteraceae bacterium]|jgi:cytochrome c peroxidase|nr:cytochrome-c peroxidase [Campylobacteraceae bacterium]